MRYKVVNILYQVPYYRTYFRWNSLPRFRFTSLSEIPWYRVNLFAQDAWAATQSVCASIWLNIRNTKCKRARSRRALATVSNGFIASENFGGTARPCGNVDRSERYPKRSRVSRGTHLAHDRTWNFDSRDNAEVTRVTCTPGDCSGKRPTWIRGCFYRRAQGPRRAVQYHLCVDTHAYARASRERGSSAYAYSDRPARSRTQHRRVFSRGPRSGRRTRAAALSAPLFGTYRSVPSLLSRGPPARTPLASGRERPRPAAPRQLQHRDPVVV